jgi:predicted 3-demethylubiquinone-9 3-methyltransferase (glyoxalase superfamily)
MKKITTCLWFDGKAEEAASFYTSVFKHSRIRRVTRYGDTGPGAPGSVMTVAFEVDGYEFLALNGGPEFSFTPAISFVVYCKSQKELDELWVKLLEGGAPLECGWLTDRYGVSWQIVPSILPELLDDDDAAKSERVMQALLKMVKIDIEELKEAYEGAGAGVR